MYVYEPAEVAGSHDRFVQNGAVFITKDHILHGGPASADQPVQHG